jgi:hypothetical protein
MLRIPDVDEILDYGCSLGFDFTQTEAEVVQKAMTEQLIGLDQFY